MLFTGIRRHIIITLEDGGYFVSIIDKKKINNLGISIGQKKYHKLLKIENKDILIGIYRPGHTFIYPDFEIDKSKSYIAHSVLKDHAPYNLHLEIYLKSKLEIKISNEGIKIFQPTISYKDYKNLKNRKKYLINCPSFIIFNNNYNKSFVLCGAKKKNNKALFIYKKQFR